ncbi:hypothetical protein [Catelliglobosispora koreensis]|uniref:hypothetical protein n=1 Tax=Catelliglobosispora koreensis TaxID=129052 RepID=UPI00037BECF4|nr:hypothetical protein [Catelliglobosispora koreensis]
MKPQGSVTRGTTNPNRLRRVDRWISWHCGLSLRDAADPLVVDLGYGATPVTAVELRSRLAAIRADVRMVGLEIDPLRVAGAQSDAAPPLLTFARGGFELAGLRPVMVRAFNVLRQYDESAVLSAWETMTSRLAPGGWLIEGTCDELGRICTWAALPAGSVVPQTLTLAAKLSTLESPLSFAERLPKALIHHNVPGSPVHTLLSSFAEAWQHMASMTVFGPRQRWIATARHLHETGSPVLYQPSRWRLGEITFPWPA